MTADYVSAEFISNFGNTEADQDVDNLDFLRFQQALKTPAKHCNDFDLTAMAMWTISISSGSVSV